MSMKAKKYKLTQKQAKKASSLFGKGFTTLDKLQAGLKKAGMPARRQTISDWRRTAKIGKRSPFQQAIKETMEEELISYKEAIKVTKKKPVWRKKRIKRSHFKVQIGNEDCEFYASIRTKPEYLRYIEKRKHLRAYQRTKYGKIGVAYAADFKHQKDLQIDEKGWNKGREAELVGLNEEVDKLGKKLKGKYSIRCEPHFERKAEEYEEDEETWYHGPY